MMWKCIYIMIGTVLNILSTLPIIVKYERGHLRYGLHFYTFFYTINI